MSGPLNFIDSLKHLRIVTAVTLEHVQDNRNQFVKSATGLQVRHAEKAIAQVRVLTVQLEREFTILEYLIAEGSPAISAPPST